VSIIIFLILHLRCSLIVLDLSCTAGGFSPRAENICVSCHPIRISTLAYRLRRLKTGGAVGFMIDGQCSSAKLAIGGVYKYKTEKCHKQINHRENELLRHPRGGNVSSCKLASTSWNSYPGSCTEPSSETTGGVWGKTGSAVDFMIDGQCISTKLAAGSVYKHKMGKCHKQINRQDFWLKDDESQVESFEMEIKPWNGCFLIYTYLRPGCIRHTS
jgi:hypothetical protein